jgi:hypothetical protein
MQRKSKTLLDGLDIYVSGNHVQIRLANRSVDICQLSTALYRYDNIPFKLSNLITLNRRRQMLEIS